MSLVKQSIETIKQNIQKDARVYWFLIDEKKNKVVLVAKDVGKTKSRNMLLEKIAQKPKKYIGARIWRITIHFYKKADKKSLAFGDVLVLLENFKISENGSIVRTFEDDKHGGIWFTKEWLEQNSWDKEYINKIINKVFSNKVKLGTVRPNMYESAFK